MSQVQCDQLKACALTSLLAFKADIPSMFDCGGAGEPCPGCNNTDPNDQGDVPAEPDRLQA
jgi:hypothetical protein